MFLPRGDRDQAGGRTTGGGGRDDCDGRNDRAGMSGISDIVRFCQIFSDISDPSNISDLSDIVRYCQTDLQKASKRTTMLPCTKIQSCFKICPEPDL